MTTTYQIERRRRGVIGWIFLVLFWLFNAFMLFSCASGMSSVSSDYSTMTSEAEKTGAAIGTGIGLTMIFSVWAAGAIVLGLIVLFTRGPKIIQTVNQGAAVADPAAAITSEGASVVSAKKRLKWWQWTLIVVGALVVVSVLAPRAPTPGATTAASSGATKPEIAGAPTASSGAPAPAATAPAPPPSSWSYRSERDEMRSATDQFAQTASLNTENMGFPYERVQMQLLLRKSAQYGRDIILMLTEGQFQCRFDGCNVHIKFDDGPIQTFSVNESDSGTGRALFIVNQSRFLSQLRHAHRLTVEAQFFDRGAEQFSFNVDRLEWEN